MNISHLVQAKITVLIVLNYLFDQYPVKLSLILCPFM